MERHQNVFFVNYIVGILKLKCNCDNGYIDNIPFAAFGVVYGDCPHYYYDTTCVKEVFDTV